MDGRLGIDHQATFSADGYGSASGARKTMRPGLVGSDNRSTVTISERKWGAFAGSVTLDENVPERPTAGDTKPSSRASLGELNSQTA